LYTDFVQYLVALLVLGTGSACSLFTVKQKPFPPLEIVATAPSSIDAPSQRVVVTEKALQIRERIQFAHNRSDILPESYALLDEIAQVLVRNPRIRLVQIEGHTDASGSAGKNKRLSTKRAQAVRKYLLKGGVAPNRLRARGFGESRPIADDGMQEGREQNRRVEFNILKQDKAK
jgi:outer membrane protein OmpA-like peptidoglycan-associated protein